MVHRHSNNKIKTVLKYVDNITLIRVNCDFDTNWNWIKNINKWKLKKKCVLLTTPHHRAWAKLLNFLFTSFSIKYTANEANISPKNPMYNVVINSYQRMKKKTEINWWIVRNEDIYFDSQMRIHFLFLPLTLCLSSFLSLVIEMLRTMKIHQLKITHLSMSIYNATE